MARKATGRCFSLRLVSERSSKYSEGEERWKKKKKEKKKNEKTKTKDKRTI